MRRAPSLLLVRECWLKSAHSQQAGLRPMLGADLFAFERLGTSSNLRCHAGVVTGSHLERRVWRPNPSLRGAAGGVGVFWLAVVAISPYVWVHPCFGAGEQCDPADRASSGEFAVFLLVIAIVGTACVSFVWVSLALDDGTLRLRKLMWRSRMIPLAEVISVRPGYSGLEIRLRSGRTEVTGAVQKSNVAQWMNRVTRADRVAAELTALAKDTEMATG